ncbi:MAG TPA: hypothetical protein VF841_05060 [Anaeromyxobacter sp.]
MRSAAAVAAILAAHLALSLGLPPEHLPVYRDAARLAWTVLAAVACAAAAASLLRGDYMRSFWIPLGAAYALLAVAEPAVARLALPGGPVGTALRAAALVAANALSVLASAVLARAYRAAGLELPSSWREAAAYAASGALSVAIVGPPLLRDAIAAVTGGGPESWAGASTGLANAAVLVLLVPVLRSALRLAGGRLAGPWWALALSALAWLAFDATELAGGRAALAGDAFRTLACLLAAVAAVHQRALVARAGGGALARVLEPTPQA